MNIIRKPFRYSFFNATSIIIALNLIVFFLTMIFPRLQVYLGMSYFGILLHYYWQPLTYLFVHSGWSHILFNMLALFFFGISVERAVGSKEFLLFFFCAEFLMGLFLRSCTVFLELQFFLWARAELFTRCFLPMPLFFRGM